MHIKTFTVKDFINYNGPCFSCKNKINFQIGVTSPLSPAVYLKPIVTDSFIDIDLMINYNHSLKLKVFTKTNKFVTSSIKDLIKYLENHNLFLRSNCDSCRTRVDSKYLELNILKEFIAPVEIEDERLIVYDDKYLYELYSYFEEKNSCVLITNKLLNNSIKIELPLLPMYKLKNKEKFLQKIKTYILFS